MKLKMSLLFTALFSFFLGISGAERSARVKRQSGYGYPAYQQQSYLQPVKYPVKYIIVDCSVDKHKCEGGGGIDNNNVHSSGVSYESGYGYGGGYGGGSSDHDDDDHDDDRDDHQMISSGYGGYQSPPSYGYQQPSYQPPSYQPPSYQPPSYQPPSYQPPSYQPPSYQPPSYQQPSYQPPAPSYQSPSPSYQPPEPSYQPPSYQAPSYQPPSYGQRSYRQPPIIVIKKIISASTTSIPGKR